jgi:3-dehydroquinate dehydratase/shikimate dehydrogenase
MPATQLFPQQPVVVCSVLERDAEATLSRLDGVPEGCGLCEIRADHLSGEQLQAVLARSDRRCIVTLRGPEHGGAFAGSADERRRLRLAALAGGRCLVDVELDGLDADLASGADADRIILSHHGARCRGDELQALLREMASTRAALLKIVPRATEPSEVTAVRDLLRACTDQRLCAFAVGREGAVSRLLAPAWGSWGSYGAAAPDRRTADGQFTVGEMLDIYRVLEIGAGTRRFGLLGRRVLRSPSPAMHAAAYRELGLDAVYLPIESDRFDATLADAEAGLDLAGLAITMPFKEPAAERCDVLDEVSKGCGSVNTIRVVGQRWHGFNTDGPAALSLARRRLDPKGTRVAIVGAGGTALSLGAVFRAAGAQVALYGRTRQRTKLASSRIDAVPGSLDDLADARWDVLVNATPLGGTGETVLPRDRLTGRLVIDVVYGNQRTRLVEDARHRGLETIDGFDLLVAQAELQFEHLLGVRPDAARLAQAGRAWLATRAPLSAC